MQVYKYSLELIDEVFFDGWVGLPLGPKKFLAKEFDMIQLLQEGVDVANRVRISQSD